MASIAQTKPVILERLMGTLSQLRVVLNAVKTLFISKLTVRLKQPHINASLVGASMLSIKYTPKWIKVLFILTVVTFPAIFMTYQVMQSQHVKCRVCMTYRGNTDCRDAQAPTKDECRRTGVDNACALLSSGMTDSIQCSNTPPKEVTFH